LKSFLIACLLYVHGFRFRDRVLQKAEKANENATKVGVGAAGAGWLLSNFFGISLVAHSSGGALLTAGSGYIAGTYVSGSIAALIAIVGSVFWFFLLPLGLLVLFRRRIGQAMVKAGSWLSK
jgi:hypothetical protein